MPQKIFLFFSIVFFVVTAVGFIFFSEPSISNNQPPIASHATGCPDTTTALVTGVIDGDTVVVDGSFFVRLLGIDADEKDEPCYQAAKNRLKDLVLHKTVVLEKDVTNVDRYNRCLRAIIIDSQNIGTVLAQEGLVLARTYLPDRRYEHEIVAAQNQAAASRTGCQWNNL